MKPYKMHYWYVSYFIAQSLFFLFNNLFVSNKLNVSARVYMYSFQSRLNHIYENKRTCFAFLVIIR